MSAEIDENDVLSLTVEQFAEKVERERKVAAEKAKNAHKGLNFKIINNYYWGEIKIGMEKSGKLELGKWIYLR